MRKDQHSQSQLMTPEAIHSTVLRDARTALWFTKLFYLPTVRNHMNKSPEGRQLQARYNGCSAFTTALTILSCGLCATCILLPHKPSWHWLAPTAIATIGAAICLKQTRYDLAQMAAHLIKQDNHLLPADLTLCQLGELYSRQYAAPSFVALSWTWDQWARKGYLLSCASAFGIFFLPLWKLILALLAAYFLANGALKPWLLARQRI